MSSWDSHFSLKQTVRPTALPVSVDEAKAHCNVQHDLDDSLIRQYIEAATGYAEKHLRRQLITATWQLKLDNWPCPSEANPWGAIIVPRPPLQSAMIVYLDENGDSQTWGPSNYTVDTSSEPGRIVPAYGVSYPSVRCVPSPITVTYVAGYTTPELIPGEIRMAVLALVSNWYEHREPVVTGTIAQNVPLHVNILLEAASVGDLVC